MSLFSKPVSQLDIADLQDLISDGAVENVRLEFKSEVPSKDETLKKLSSFANTFGGFMVVGAKAGSGDGRIEALPGVDPEPGYKQKLVQWCFDAVNPPLIVEVSDPISVPSSNGKVCYVAHIVESEVAPHFLNGRKGLWIRTDEFSSRFEPRLANESELRYLFDRRKQVRDRRQFLIARAQGRLRAFLNLNLPTGSASAEQSLFTFVVSPRFPVRQLCEQERLKSLLLNNDTLLQWRQVIFPDIGKPTISQFESLIMPNPARGLSFLEVNTWGLLFYAVQIDRDDLGSRGIHLGQFIGYCLAFIQHSGRLLRAAGYSGPLHIESSLNSVQGVQWFHPNRWGSGFVPHDGSNFDDQIAFLTPKSSDELLEKPDALAIDILRNVFFSVNSPDLVDTQQKVEELIRRGYEYNGWQIPDTLGL